MSSRRALVQEPMNTRSTGISSIGVPGRRPMYSSARVILLRAESLDAPSGSGTRSVMGVAIAGFVPQVTNGASDELFISTVASKLAPASLLSWLQAFVASSQWLEAGANRLFLRYEKVISSVAIMAARAPASMLMLQMVMRDSMESARMVS